MILLRHGQSEFNLAFTATKRDPGIPDPKLTPHGEEQALAAALALGDAGIKRIICSPYTRALQTVAPIAERLRVPVTITPTVRERYAFSCDIGTSRTHLQRDWPHLDFGHIDEIWWPAIEEPDAQIEARARLFRGEMETLPGWQDTLVVSHWGFILAMTGERVMNGQWLRCDPTGPAPTEIVWRQYHPTVVQP